MTLFRVIFFAYFLNLFQIFTFFKNKRCLKNDIDIIYGSKKSTKLRFFS